MKIQLRKTVLARLAKYQQFRVFIYLAIANASCMISRVKPFCAGGRKTSGTSLFYCFRDPVECMQLNYVTHHFRA